MKYARLQQLVVASDGWCSARELQCLSLAVIVVESTSLLAVSPESLSQILILRPELVVALVNVDDITESAFPCHGM
jgi:hypothetical protein